ncbi:MAG: PorT family protein [Cyclobacteriaceae bacterium]
MKKRTHLLLAIILLSGSLSAQQFRSGVKGGFNYSSLYVDDVEDRKIRPGFHAGFFVQSELVEAVGIQTELLFTTAGNRTTYDVGPFDGTVDFNLNYVQLPVMLNLKVVDILEFHGGLYAAYLVGANTSTEGDFGSGFEELDRDNFKDLDFGFAAGLGVNFGNLQAGLRYNLGLTEIADSDSSRDLLGDSKNVVGQIYVAIGF